MIENINTLFEALCFNNESEMEYANNDFIIKELELINDNLKSQLIITKTSKDKLQVNWYIIVKLNDKFFYYFFYS